MAQQHSIGRGAHLGAREHRENPAVPAQQRWDAVDLLVAVGLSVLALLVVGNLVAHAMQDAMPSVRSGSTAAAMILLVAGFAAYVVAVVPLVVLLRVRHGTTLADLGWTRPASMQAFLLVVPITLGAMMLSGVLGAISRALMPAAHNPQCHQLSVGGGAVVLVAVLVAVVAPIAEETLFRGFLYRWLEQRMAWSFAVPLSALVFAGAHRILLILLPIFAVGIVLALVFRHTRSIWPGACVHALNNAVVLLAVFYGLGAC